MMHFITRKVEGLEARQGHDHDDAAPEPVEELAVRVEEVEQRVADVEQRVDRLTEDYEAADNALKPDSQ